MCQCPGRGVHHPVPGGVQDRARGVLCSGVQDGAPDREQGAVPHGGGAAVQDLLQARVRDQDQPGVRTQGAGSR